MVNDILDVGCGWHKQPDSIGIDVKSFDPYFNKVHNHNVIASGDFLPFTSNCFRKVYCFEVLEHCYNPKGVLDEIHRVLKQEGYVFISIPNPYWIMRFVKHCFYNYADYGAMEHIFGWTFAEIKSLVRLCNFSIDNHLFISFMYRVKKRKWFKVKLSKVLRHLTNYSLLLVLRKK